MRSVKKCLDVKTVLKILVLEILVLKILVLKFDRFRANRS